MVCAAYHYKSSGAPEVQLLWQAPLRAIRDVKLKNMPLALTFYIDRQAAKHGAPGSAGVGGGAMSSSPNVPPPPPPTLAPASSEPRPSGLGDEPEAPPSDGAAPSIVAGGRSFLARHAGGGGGGGGGGAGGGDDEHHIVHKRVTGDWHHDSVPLMRVYNLVKCLLGRADEYVRFPLCAASSCCPIEVFE